MITPTIYPRLGNGAICEIKGIRYRAELTQSASGNYYDFINISDRDVPDFKRTEQVVSDALKNKLIIKL